MDSNQRRTTPTVLQTAPLATRATRLASARSSGGWKDSELHRVRSRRDGGRRSEGWGSVAGDSSFDVVSKVDRQEVENALNQAAKEIQRYDFKGVDASIAWSGETILRRRTARNGSRPCSVSSRRS